MTQDEIWSNKYAEVVAFIEKNKRNPSKYDPEERGRYLNWLRHNRKLFHAGELKPDRAERFRELLALTEKYRRKNQYDPVPGSPFSSSFLPFEFGVDVCDDGAADVVPDAEDCTGDGCHRVGGEVKRRQR